MCPALDNPLVKLRSTRDGSEVEILDIFKEEAEGLNVFTVSGFNFTLDSQEEDFFMLKSTGSA